MWDDDSFKKSDTSDYPSHVRVTTQMAYSTIYITTSKYIQEQKITSEDSQYLSIWIIQSVHPVHPIFFLEVTRQRTTPTASELLP
jgi:hypothetical protein